MYHLRVRKRENHNTKGNISCKEDGQGHTRGQKKGGRKPEKQPAEPRGTSGGAVEQEGTGKSELEHETDFF